MSEIDWSAIEVTREDIEKALEDTGPAFIRWMNAGFPPDGLDAVFEDGMKRHRERRDT